MHQCQIRGTSGCCWLLLLDCASWPTAAPAAAAAAGMLLLLLVLLLLLLLLHPSPPLEDPNLQGPHQSHAGARTLSCPRLCAALRTTSERARSPLPALEQASRGFLSAARARDAQRAAKHWQQAKGSSTTRSARQGIVRQRAPIRQGAEGSTKGRVREKLSARGPMSAGSARYMCTKEHLRAQSKHDSTSGLDGLTCRVVGMRHVEEAVLRDASRAPNIGGRGKLQPGAKASKS